MSRKNIEVEVSSHGADDVKKQLEALNQQIEYAKSHGASASLIGDMEKEAEGLKKAAAAQSQLNEKTHEGTESHTELRHVFGLFRGELGEFAHLANFIFNPYLLALAAGTIGFNKLREVNAKLTEELAAMNTQALQPAIERYKTYAEVMDDARQRQHALNDELRQMKEAQGTAAIDADIDARTKHADAILAEMKALADLKLANHEITQEQHDAMVGNAEATNSAEKRKLAHEKAVAAIDAEANKDAANQDKINRLTQGGMTVEKYKERAKAKQTQQEQADSSVKTLTEELGKIRAGDLEGTSEWTHMTPARQAEYKAAFIARDFGQSPLGKLNPVAVRASKNAQAHIDKVNSEAEASIAGQLKQAVKNAAILKTQATTADANAKELSDAQAAHAKAKVAIPGMVAAEKKRQATDEDAAKSEAKQRASKFLQEYGKTPEGQLLEGAARAMEHQQQAKAGNIFDSSLNGGMGGYRKAKFGETVPGLSAREQGTIEEFSRQFGGLRPDQVQQLKKAFESHGSDVLKDILDALGKAAGNQVQFSVKVQQLSAQLDRVAQQNGNPYPQ